MEQEKVPLDGHRLTLTLNVQTVFDWIDLVARLDECLANHGEAPSQPLRRRLNSIKNDFLTDILSKLDAPHPTAETVDSVKLPASESEQKKEEGEEGNAKPEDEAEKVETETADDDDAERLKAFVHVQKEKQAAIIRDYPLHDLDEFKAKPSEKTAED